ncbi:hypothetical protein G7046_g6813 [Stylonectria norvegica]|nr:hypothetical protein G7046_g6813 [Stylonectria norvegica]
MRSKRDPPYLYGLRAWDANSSTNPIVSAPTSPEQSGMDFTGLSAGESVEGEVQFASRQLTSLHVVNWPQDVLPVEIFEIITSHLSRLEVKRLRLVCREFEAKVTAQYFRNVVVPFKSELYSTLSRDKNGSFRASQALFSNGMRIFKSFGPHIVRFALSLELNEQTLAYPPVKPSQEAIPTFWGIYRWPHTTYHRYTDLEGLEHTADETEAMKEALKCLVKVTNLGLCCDAGLGFLIGPDFLARNAAQKHPVFATQDWRRSKADSYRQNQPIVTMADFNTQAERSRKSSFTSPMSFKNFVLRKMVVDAGFCPSEAEEAVRLVLATEGSSLSLIDFDERCSGRNERRSRAQTHGYTEYNQPPFDGTNYPLIPASLTRAQKEMLLELEWAHRAMIQSYVIGLIDNASAGAFQNLTTLTIAKIPSSHVYIFYRHELWESLANLNDISLGVIADWRRISKPAPGCVDDTPVSPLDAVEKVYKLLSTYIAPTKNIESLHFEWICGGELAASTFQRNHYILPVPFFPSPELMAGMNTPKIFQDKILDFPYIKHLSLKNCWASPHVLLQTIRQMALQSLEKLELESVSLSGPPTNSAQPPLHQPGGIMWNLFLAGPQGDGPIPAPQPILPPVTPSPELVQALGFTQAQQLAQHHAEAEAIANAHTHNFPQHPHIPFFDYNMPGHNPQNPEFFPADHHPPMVGPVQQQVMPHPPVPAPPLQPQPPAPNTPERLEQPEWLSWPGIVEHFSPGIKIRDILAQQLAQSLDDPEPSALAAVKDLEPFLPRAKSLHRDEKQYTLKCLSFKSCGYIVVDGRYLNSRSILPHGAQGIRGNNNPHGSEFDSMMQRCRDPLLGRILPSMKETEVFQLVNAFGMRMGWDTIYDEKTIDDAAADGIEQPGRGRFSGVIDACSPETREAKIAAMLPRDETDGVHH